MKNTGKEIVVILIIFGAFATTILITGIFFPEQWLQQFMIWYRATAFLQIFLVLVCLRLMCKLQRLQRMREENKKLKSDLGQNGVMK